MTLKGKIREIHPEGLSSVYKYVCQDPDGRRFSFPVEYRYHFNILEHEGEPRGRGIEYDDGMEPPVVRFLD